MANSEQVRASFDIGSGATKLTIARVGLLGDDGAAEVREVLFEEYTEVLYGHDLKRRGPGEAKELSEEIMAHGRAVFQRYHELCMSPRFRVAKASGIATAVFREADNGPAFLEALQQDFGLSLHLIRQEEEAVLGFRTAVAVVRQTHLEGDITSWDSGGSSFQLVSLRERGHSVESDVEEKDRYEMYCGSLGASKVTAMMVTEVQGGDFSQRPSPNPVSRKDAMALVGLLSGQLPEAPAGLIKRAVVGVGGSDCMFAVAQMAVSNLGDGCCNIITSEQLLLAIDAECFKTDAELARYPQPAMVVPKLCLMYSVMTGLQFSSALYAPSNGSNLAVLCDRRFWCGT